MTDPVAAAGPRLKAERERRNLSPEKAGNEMHLDAWVIEALESEDYPRVGPEVYVKGHLKRYAEMLGLPAAEILAAYQARPRTSTPAAAPPPSNVRMPTSPPPVNNVAWTQVGGAAAAAILLLGLLWWKPWRHRDAAPPTAPAKLDAAASAAASAPLLAATENTPPPLPLPAAPSAAAPAAPPAAPAAPPASPAPDADAGLGAGRARLRLSFSADSWVDVHDAEGHRAYAGNGRANSVKTIAGSAPMRVYLGFASGVQLEINNRAVAIGRQFMAGDVARFEAGADGVLRRDSHAAAAPSAQNRTVRPPG